MRLHVAYIARRASTRAYCAVRKIGGSGEKRRRKFLILNPCNFLLCSGDKHTHTTGASMSYTRMGIETAPTRWVVSPFHRMRFRGWIKPLFMAEKPAERFFLTCYGLHSVPGAYLIENWNQLPTLFCAVSHFPQSSVPTKYDRAEEYMED